MVSAKCMAMSNNDEISYLQHFMQMVEHRLTGREKSTDANRQGVQSMNNGKKSAASEKMREHAETRGSASPGTDEAINEVSVLKRLLHELQVHQVELEMENANSIRSFPREMRWRACWDHTGNSTN